jgi:hypothetical protein
MQNIWGRSSESALSGEELRDEVQLHLARHLGDPHIAFSDNDGWAGNSREPGPAVDVLVVPPEGERRFAYVCTFGSSLKKRPGDITGGRMEFALAVPQHGDPQSDLAMLNLGANTVRQFAKLVHIQPIRVFAGETVLSSAVITWKEGLIYYIQKLLDDTLEADDDAWPGLAEGANILTPVSSLVSPQHAVAVESERQRLITEGDDIFCNLTRNDGMLGFPPIGWRRGPTGLHGWDEGTTAAIA